MAAGSQRDVIAETMPTTRGPVTIRYDRMDGGIGAMETMASTPKYAGETTEIPHYWGYGLDWACAQGACNTPVIFGATTAYATNYQLVNVTPGIGQNGQTMLIGKVPDNGATITGYRELQGCSIAGWTLEQKQNDLAKLKIKWLCQDLNLASVVNDDAQQALETFTDAGFSDCLHFRHASVWMNAQDGAALQASDAICLTDFTIDVDYGLTAKNTTCSGGLITIPEQENKVKVTLTCTWDKYDTYTYIQAITQSTAFKARIQYTGDVLAGVAYYDKLDFWFPNLIPVAINTNVSGAGWVPHVVTFEGMGVTTEPTGFSDGTANIHEDILEPIRIIEISKQSAAPIVAT
jgi:hypothetical protein